MLFKIKKNNQKKKKRVEFNNKRKNKKLKPNKKLNQNQLKLVKIKIEKKGGFKPVEMYKEM
jgi:hypothetical protein